jgi:hypothetical protein
LTPPPQPPHIRSGGFLPVALRLFLLSAHFLLEI